MKLEVGGDQVTIAVSSEASAGAMLAFEVEMPAGGGPPMLHRHEAFELYRVERGELAFYLADDAGAVQRAVARPNTVVAIEGGREHTIRNESDAAASAFVVFSPGAEMERFVRGAAGAAGVEDVLALAAAHGIELTRAVD